MKPLTDSSRPWCFRSWFIIPQLLFCLFPWFGIGLMWAGNRYHFSVRIAVTAAIGVMWLSSLSVMIASSIGPISTAASSPQAVSPSIPTRNIDGKDRVRSELLRGLSDLPKGKIQRIDVVDYSDGGYQVTIEYQVTGYKVSLLVQAINIFSDIYQSPHFRDVNNVWLKPHAKLSDPYGNSSLDMVGKVIIDRKLGQKINWTEMYPDQLERLLRSKNNDTTEEDGTGTIWLHPALD